MTAIPQSSTTTGSGSRIFGEALAHWLQKAEKGHKEVAHSIQVQVSALSHWLAGRKRPSPTHLMRLLVHLHTWLGPAWTVADALDTIAPLGRTWEDVRQTLGNLHGPEIPDFREWWEKGKPQPLLPAYLPLPAVYVEREEHRRLREMLTDWAAWRQPRWRAVVVTGVAGAGKTTLLAALARDPAIRRSFRDGILWLNGAGKELLAQAAHRIGLDGPPQPSRKNGPAGSETPAAASSSSWTTPSPMPPWTPSSPASAPRSCWWSPPRKDRKGRPRWSAGSPRIR